MTEPIILGTTHRGYTVFKIPNKDVGGWIYYSDENCPSDIGGLPVLADALHSVDVVEIILNDMKKVSNEKR